MRQKLAERIYDTIRILEGNIFELQDAIKKGDTQIPSTFESCINMDIGEVQERCTKGFYESEKLVL